LDTHNKSVLLENQNCFSSITWKLKFKSKNTKKLFKPFLGSLGILGSLTAGAVFAKKSSALTGFKTSGVFFDSFSISFFGTFE
jgi:hypothetical protein